MTTPARPFYPQEGPLWPEPEKRDPRDRSLRFCTDGRSISLEPVGSPLHVASEEFVASMLDWASRDH